jgi:transcriptional regulator with XRE-family HTH domain
MLLGDRIEAMVKFSGLNQQEFTKRIGVSKSTFHNWKSGEKGIAFEYLGRILHAYAEINPRWLILGEGEMLIPQNHQVQEPSSPYGSKPITKADLSRILKKIIAEIDKV